MLEANSINCLFSTFCVIIILKLVIDLSTFYNIISCVIVHDTKIEFV